MMTTRRGGLGLLGLLAILLLAAPAAAEDYDKSFPAPAGTRLQVRLFGGEVVVRAGDRNSVRLRATHFRTDSIEVQRQGSVLSVRARSRVGPPHAIDVTLEVPAWMPLSIAGTYLDITIAGSRASVSAETVRGDVRLNGGAGSISLKSIEGEVILEGAQGHTTLTAVNNGIRVKGLDGDLVAETVNGSVSLDGVRSRSVDVGTVSGDISWTGALRAAGRYQFATHGGDIDITLDAHPDATVAVRAFEGRFHSGYPAAGQPGGEGTRRRFVLGAGSARLDLETFRGTISVRPPTPQTPRGTGRAESFTPALRRNVIIGHQLVKAD